MLKDIRKIISLLLVLCMCVITAGFTQTAYAETAGSELNKASFLKSINIIPSDRGMAEVITRAEFASGAYKMLDIKGTAYSEQFEDVPKTHWAYEYIMGMRDFKYMLGTAENMFYPEQAITAEQAIKVLINILGYSFVAEENGGYPSGYINTAIDIGLTNGLSQAFSGDLTFGEAVKLFYNALSIKMMETDYTGSYVIGNETILNSCLNICKISGRVNANEAEALKGQAQAEDYVMIGDFSYLVGDTDIENYLGAEIEGFAKKVDDGNRVIVYFYTHSDIIEISSEDILDRTTTKNLVYSVDDKIREQSIPKDVTFIYNGKLYFSYGLGELKPKTGTVTLIKNNGKLECIKVMDYEVNIVDTYNKKDNTIYFKKNGACVDLSKSDVIYRIKKGSSIYEDKDFSEYDVINIAKSKDEKMVTLIITNDILDGMITSVDNKKIYIDKVGYSLSKNLLSDKNSFKLNSCGTFYFDFLGNIVYMKYSSDSNNYCYLLRKSYDDFTGEIKIKYINSEGEVKIGSLTKNAQYNDVRLSESGNEIDIILNTLVKLKINSMGYINKIETPIDNSANKSIKYDDSKFSMDMSGASLRYLSKANGLITDGTRVWCMPATTPVLSIERDKNGAVNEENCMLVTAKDIMVSSKEYSNLSFFDVNDETYAPSFIIRTYNGWSIMDTDGNKSSVIKDIFYAMGDDGIETRAVDFYNDGELKTALIKESAYNAIEKCIPDEYKNFTIDDLTAGDVCLFTQNKSGDILGFMPSFVKSKTTEDKILSKDTSGYEQIRGYESVYGMVDSANGFQVTVCIDGAEYNYLLSETNAYIYNEHSDVLPISLNDVRGYIGKKCYIRANRKVIETIIIYE